jgi:hypothetical protein
MKKVFEVASYCTTVATKLVEANSPEDAIRIAREELSWADEKEEVQETIYELRAPTHVYHGSEIIEFFRKGEPGYEYYNEKSHKLAKEKDIPKVEPAPVATVLIHVQDDRVESVTATSPIKAILLTEENEFADPGEEVNVNELEVEIETEADMLKTIEETKAAVSK